MEFSRTDYHIFATALARTINIDLELLARLEVEYGNDYAFMLDLVIERLFLLNKIEKEAGQGLQTYLLNPNKVYDTLVIKRNDYNAEQNAAYLKALEASA